MNFLAHFYLTYPDRDLSLGNFLGDFVKGKAYREFPSDISRGILLHREIDHYTDHHPVHQQSKRRLGQHYGHFAGIAIDMFYDYLLATQWQQYAEISLRQFSRHIYQILYSGEAHLTESALYVLRHMSEHDWLYHYSTEEGIARALSGISRRTPYKNHLEHAVLDLKRNFPLFKEDFDVFFPQLISHTRNHLNFLS